MSALSTALHRSDHVVHFYRTEESFSDAVGDFCARALESGEPLLLVATPDHRDVIRRGLVMRGLDWDGAVRLGRVECYDARQVLDALLVNGMPDERLFREQLDPLLNGVAGRFGPGTTIRVFGEMVDLLCQAGAHDAAIELEHLWNDLARTHDFSLLCAYSMGNFYREVNGRAYQEICRAHTHVHRGAVARESAAEDTETRPTA